MVEPIKSTYVLYSGYITTNAAKRRVVAQIYNLLPWITNNSNTAFQIRIFEVDGEFELEIIHSTYSLPHKISSWRLQNCFTWVRNYCRTLLPILTDIIFPSDLQAKLEYHKWLYKVQPRYLAQSAVYFSTGRKPAFPEQSQGALLSCGTPRRPIEGDL